MNSTTDHNNTKASAATAPAASAAKPKLEEPDRAMYSEAKARRTPLTFCLRNGHEITGIVSSFGAFTVRVETSTGPVVIHKHAIDLIAIAGASPLNNARPTSPSPPASGPIRPPIGNSSTRDRR